MFKLIYFSFLFFLTLIVNGQNNTKSAKGVSADEDNTITGTCRALIVGISKYQNIKSLEYADRDAIEFARFLSGNTVWNLPADNLFLLTNEQAKAGNILSALTSIIDSSKSGDNLIFYFSGHGDVETIEDSSQGFLLAYDSPPNNYTTGAISISILQKAFGQLISKGVKLILITDACRSGHLAGGVQGVAQTAKAFNLQWKNQTKILSAQPDEVSYEGKEWGGGRGVFSFFLVKGLYGFADANHDSIVTLSEIEQYAGLQIAEETKFKQQPIFEGPSKFSLQVAKVDTIGMKSYIEWKTKSEISVFVINKTTERSNNKNIPAQYHCPGYDSLDQMLNKEKLDSGEWVKALNLYNSIQDCALQLRGNIKYKISSLLMNNIQQTVNQSLLGQKLIGLLDIDEALKKIDWLFKINNDKAIFYYSHFINLRRYLAVIKLTHIDAGSEREIYFIENNLAGKMDSAIQLEPGAAYLSFAKGISFFSIRDNNVDSALFYFTKAQTFSPTWLMPKLMIAHVYNSDDNIDSALYWYESILRMDTFYQKFECNICFYQELADLYNSKKKYTSAEIVYNLGLAVDHKNRRLMWGLVEVYSATKQDKKMQTMLAEVETYDTSITDKLESLELIINNRILKKDKIEKRLEDISKSLDEINEKDTKINIAQALLEYVNGLFKEEYNFGNGINNFETAFEMTEDADYSIKFRLAYIKTCIKYLRLENHGEALGENIDFTMERFKQSLSKSDIFELNFYKALSKLFAGNADDKVVNDLNKWFNKKMIDCEFIKSINASLRYLQKNKMNFHYPIALKSLFGKCNL